MKRIFLILFLLSFFNIFSMENEQTFILRDNSVVKINPKSIVIKLDKLSAKELLRLKTFCDHFIKSKNDILVSNNQQKKPSDLIRVALKVGIIRENKISFDVINIIKNSIVFQGIYDDSLQIGVINPLKNRNECVIL